jgi:hypothetical protein
MLCPGAHHNVVRIIWAQYQDDMDQQRELAIPATRATEDCNGWYPCKGGVEMFVSFI